LNYYCLLDCIDRSMGNCQAAEAATVVIQHNNNKVERIYWSVSAHEVMSSNPGHYVALVVPVASTAATGGNGTTVKQLKLLRPDDTLVIGQVYRLISFEDVLKEFAAKKCVKLGKLLEKGGIALDKKKLPAGWTRNPNPKPENDGPLKMEGQVYRSLRSGRGGGGGGIGRLHQVGGGQWKPALQSISEVGI